MVSNLGANLVVVRLTHSFLQAEPYGSLGLLAIPWVALPYVKSVVVYTSVTSALTGNSLLSRLVIQPVPFFPLLQSILNVEVSELSLHNDQKQAK
jgi:hypothetical protein